MEYRWYGYRRFFRHALSFPVIWFLFLPILLLDFFMEIYHRTCFPLYGIPYVNRSAYIRIDRHKLSYLAWYDKINCMYCGYANGFFYYGSAIAGETEKYWCGIKHQQVQGALAQPHQKDFVDYGDEVTFKEKYCGKKKSSP